MARPSCVSILTTAASVRIVAPKPRGGAAHRGGHAAHAAFGEAPRADRALADVADLVMGHDVRATRRARPGPRADYAGHRQDAAHLGRLEPLLERLAMLIVISRVMSTMPRSSSLRIHATAAATRSAGALPSAAARA